MRSEVTGASGRARRDPIRAALVSVEEVLFAPHDDRRAEGLLEQDQLRAAQSAAALRRSLDRTVVLDQREVIVLVDDLGEVALGAAQFGESMHAGAGVGRVVECGPVR